MAEIAPTAPHIEITITLSAEEASALAGALYSLADDLGGTGGTGDRIYDLAVGLDQFDGGDWTFIDAGASLALNVALKRQPKELTSFIARLGSLKVTVP